MATIIEQEPLYNVLPVGQQVMFSVSNGTIVANQLEVKFVAEIHISNTPINLNTSTDLIATLKTTPNNEGIGIFDLRPMLETFVKPDNEPYSEAPFVSEYKGTPALTQMFPIHLVDKYSLSNNSIKYFAIRFSVDYIDATTLQPVLGTDAEDSAGFTFFNGVIQYDDVLTLDGNDYGYNLELFELTDSDSKFLSNAPTTQYARLTDYGTFPFLNFVPTSTDKVTSMTLRYYDSSDVQLGVDYVLNDPANGGVTAVGNSNTMLNYFGGFPANLDGWSTTWDTHKANISYYTIRDGNGESVLYRINILCPNERGYEGIRLTWLNQWGAWDYYTFNKKSVRSLTTNRSTYTQQSGTWNESTFKIAGYKGGQKNFRVNSTERIKMNTDFVTEAEGVWFEELINSNEVYILNGFQDDTANTITNKYVEPVRLTTSSYTRKTIANDKLMQYTFEVEKSKMKRTQAV